MKLTVKETARLIMHFVEDSAPQLHTCSTFDDDTGEPVIEILSVNDTLAMWSQLPDSQYSHMFLGWLIAKGYPVSVTDPAVVEKAVMYALTGHENVIVPTYNGDTDAPQKPS